ncbi:MAG: hypothetical protein JWP89_1169 [Schlesneria sp.]|nr:hypothetical protein [Schlesneria sp.]
MEYSGVIVTLGGVADPYVLSDREMMFIQPHQFRMASIQSLLLATAVSLCAFSTNAHAALIFESFSPSASDLVKTASLHDFELMPDSSILAPGSDDSMAAGSESIGDSSPLATAALFWQIHFFPNGCSNDTGASGSSTTGPQSVTVAICEYSTALSGWTLINWLDRTSFQFLPDAPRSGLMRPPQGHIA